MHYVGKPIGYERDQLVRDENGVTLTSDFEFTDRGGRVPLTAVLLTTPDLTPVSFVSKGKTYRFVNVDTEVHVAAHELKTIDRVRGVEGGTVNPPATFYTADGYAPFAAQMLMLRYWKAHGRPRTLPTFAGDGKPMDVIIEERGRDTVKAGDRSISLTQFVVDGVVWGRETLWLDQDDLLAAAITRAGGLSFEAVREDLEPALQQFVSIAARDRIKDIAAITSAIRPAHAGSYALVGATIVDMTGRAPIADGVVVVRDGRIAEVGPRSAVTLDPSTPRVDVSGKTILPGLWDMHTHFTQVEWAAVYLGAGVTTVRDMGNETGFIVPMRDAIRSHATAGPRLLLAGLVDASGPNAFGTVYADTPEEAARVVADYHDRGFEQMKIYCLVKPPIVQAISSAAHRLGMGVTGHLPNGMTMQQAIDDGMDGIAHLAIRGEPGSDEVKQTIAYMREHGTYIDPTQSWGELLGHSMHTDIGSFQPGFPKIPPPLQRLFASAGSTTLDPAAARARVERGLKIVNELHQAGVPIVAGTDEGVPGHAVPREIELYVEAGLSPLEALKTATVVPARVMKLDGELGTIERGKRADLIVLDANPLESIRNIRTVRWTITDGKMYESAEFWKAVRFLP